MPSARGSDDLRRHLLHTQQQRRTSANSSTRPDTPDVLFPDPPRSAPMHIPRRSGRSSQDENSQILMRDEDQQQQHGHSPPFELIDHYTLRQPLKVVGSSGRRRYVIDGLQHQLIFEAERLPSSGGSQMRRRRPSRNVRKTANNTAADDNGNKIRVTVRRARTYGLGVVFLKLVYVYVSAVLFGFFFFFCVLVLLQYALGVFLPGLTSGRPWLSGLTLFAMPTFLDILASLVVLASGVVNDIWNDFEFLHSITFVPRLIRDWLPLVLLLLAPLGTLVVSLFWFRVNASGGNSNIIDNKTLRDDDVNDPYLATLFALFWGSFAVFVLYALLAFGLEIYACLNLTGRGVIRGTVHLIMSRYRRKLNLQRWDKATEVLARARVLGRHTLDVRERLTRDMLGTLVPDPFENRAFIMKDVWSIILRMLYHPTYYRVWEMTDFEEQSAFFTKQALAVHYLLCMPKRRMRGTVAWYDVINSGLCMLITFVLLWAASFGYAFYLTQSGWIALATAVGAGGAFLAAGISILRPLVTHLYGLSQQSRPADMNAGDLDVSDISNRNLTSADSLSRNVSAYVPPPLPDSSSFTNVGAMGSTSDVRSSVSSSSDSAVIAGPLGLPPSSQRGMPLRGTSTTTSTTNASLSARRGGAGVRGNKLLIGVGPNTNSVQSGGVWSILRSHSVDGMGNGSISTGGDGRGGSASVRHSQSVDNGMNAWTTNLGAVRAVSDGGLGATTTAAAASVGVGVGVGEEEEASLFNLDVDFGAVLNDRAGLVRVAVAEPGYVLMFLFGVLEIYLFVIVPWKAFHELEVEVYAQLFVAMAVLTATRKVYSLNYISSTEESTDLDHRDDRSSVGMMEGPLLNHIPTTPINQFDDQFNENRAFDFATDEELAFNDAIDDNAYVRSDDIDDEANGGNADVSNDVIVIDDARNADASDSDGGNVDAINDDAINNDASNNDASNADASNDVSNGNDEVSNTNSNNIVGNGHVAIPVIDGSISDDAAGSIDENLNNNNQESIGHISSSDNSGNTSLQSVGGTDVPVLNVGADNDDVGTVGGGGGGRGGGWFSVFFDGRPLKKTTVERGDGDDESQEGGNGIEGVGVSNGQSPAQVRRMYLLLTRMKARKARNFIVGLLCTSLLISMMLAFATLFTDVSTTDYPGVQIMGSASNNTHYIPTPGWRERGVMYPSCTMQRLSDLSPFLNDTTAPILNMLDYAFIADTAYANLSHVQTQLDLWFGQGVMTDETIKYSHLIPIHSKTIFRVLVMSNARGGGTVVSIRGTHNAFDLLADFEMWLPAAMMKLVRTLLPMGQVWNRFIPHLVGYMGQIATTRPNSIVQYDQDVVVLVKGLRKEFPGSPIVLTGHSLGGGLAMITGARERVPALAFSGTNSMLSHVKFGITARALDKYTINIVPESDPVPHLDDPSLVAENIRCRAPMNAGIGACHSLGRSICEIMYTCGSGRRPAISNCHEFYGFSRASNRTTPLPPEGIEEERLI